MMRLKRPRFWKRKGVFALLLLLPSLLYHCYFLARKHTIKTVKVPIPVICVGNVIVGGSGKTPVAIAIGELLQKHGRRIAFLSRGYGGQLKKEILEVLPYKHSAKEVGDEPLLLAAHAPTFVTTNRLKAAMRIASLKKYDAIILDDGMQNMTIHKDITLLVSDGSYHIGNGLLMPSGPLREPLKCGIERCHAVINITHNEDDKLIEVENKPCFTAKFEITERPFKKGEKIMAFAGIGHPEKFFNTLADCDYELVAKIEFPDHYPYKIKDISKLVKQAGRLHAKLITTEKDWVRLPQKLKSSVSFLPVKINFSHTKELEKLILKIVKKHV